MLLGGCVESICSALRLSFALAPLTLLYTAGLRVREVMAARTATVSMPAVRETCHQRGWTTVRVAVVVSPWLVTATARASMGGPW
jgi:hypothetical protein